MADYLTRLVERTLQLSPRVRPDIPPTFAPESGGTLLGEPPEGPAPDRYSPSPSTDRDEALEERYNDPHSTAGDRSHTTRNAGESAAIEPRPAGDEPPREPEEPRRRPTAAPPDSPASDEAMQQDYREPETSEIGPDRRESPPPASPGGIPETVEYTKARTEIIRRSTEAANARTSAPPGDNTPPSPGRPSGGFATSPGRRAAGSSGARARAVPPHDDTAQDESFPSVRERPAVPDHPVSGPEEHVHPAEPSSPETGARGRSHGAPGRTEPDSSSRASRRPVSEAPVVPHEGRRGDAVPLESAAPNRPGTTERTPPPTVRVTIGRIEVRAIPPVPEPAQPLPESKPLPTLSLDDYLRRHSGARR